MGQSFSFVLDEGVYISKAKTGFSELKKRRKQLKSLGQSPPPVAARSSSLGLQSKEIYYEYQDAYEEILTVPYIHTNESFSEYFDEGGTMKFIRPRSVVDINLSLLNTR
jgi:hypothetical protein